MAKLKINKKLQNLLMVVLLFLGIGILVYPDIANWWYNNRHVAMLQEYSDVVDEMSAEEIEYELERARVFNASLSGIHIEDPFVPQSGSVISAEYYSILNFDGVMGIIEVPAIDVSLPIFHGTSDETLDRGAGHMENTPFPIGGYGNHSIITAHTGLVNMRLFTDLILLEEGDLFFVEVLNKRIAYEVDRIDIVYPHEIEILVSYEDRDLITLVTCTPYGVNSHRLLVRGTRTEYFPNMANEISDIRGPLNIRLIIIIGFSLLFLIIIIFFQNKKRKLAKSFDQLVEQEYEEWKRRKDYD